MCFTGCFKPCFLRKQSALPSSFCSCMAVCPCHSQDFLSPGLPPIFERSAATHNVTFLKALRNLAAGHQDCEDASSHTPQRHFVSSKEKTVMGTCAVRHSDEEKKFMKSALVSVLKELLWAHIAGVTRIGGKWSKGHFGYSAPWWMEGLCSQATKMVWKVLLLVPTTLEAKLTGFIFFLERCKRAKSRGS